MFSKAEKESGKADHSLEIVPKPTVKAVLAPGEVHKEANSISAQRLGKDTKKKRDPRCHLELAHLKRNLGNPS